MILKKILKAVIILYLFSLTIECTARNNKKKLSPNIIFILIDDLNWGDLGCYGQQKIETPNIDRIANEGIKFNQAYCGNSVCAPSRSALLQGKHPGHARVRGNSFEGYRESLQEEDFTVAMLLKQAGYNTGLFGKWGLGLYNQPGLPNNMGFDQFFGYLNQGHAHCHYPEFLYHNKKRVFFPENGTHYILENYRGEQYYDENGICHPLGIKNPSKAKYAFDVYCKKSLEFVRENRENPFFLYLAYTPPHGSYIVPELGIYTNKDWPLSHKIYAAMVTRVDSEIGKLIQLLEELNIDENTLIIFASDNGNTSSNAREGEIPTSIFFNSSSPTRGMKGNLYDGAFNVPAIARWPKYIHPGQESNHIWAFWDFLPTVADIIGVQPPGNIDGISFLPVLLGNSEEQKKHYFLYWEYKQEQAVRMHEWYGYKNKQGKLEVYNLKENPQQNNNLSSQFPEITKQINKIMKAEHTPSDVWPSPGETKEEFHKRLEELGVHKRPDNHTLF